MQPHDRIDAFVRTQVALGSKPPAAIVDDVVQHLGGGQSTVDPAVAWGTVTVALAEHRAAQADWPRITDSDRLTAAFRDLDGSGILAREDFACCQNCGLAELGGELTDGETARGYAFYHHQDAMDAADGHGLHIAYGRFEQPPSVEVGEEVAAALRQHGLTVEWSGDAGERIGVSMRWQRRRHGRLAAVPAAADDDVEVGVERLDEWSGRYAPTAETMSAATLAGVYLPWLPADTRIRLTAEGAGTVTVARSGSELVGVYSDPAVPDVKVGRHAAMDVVRRLLGRASSGSAASETGLLEVTYQYPGDTEYHSVPLDLAETLDLVRRMPPGDGTWWCCVGVSNGVLQARGDRGQLWLETPDPGAGVSRGRHVSLDETERMVTALAVEDRVAVDDLGDLEVVTWR